MYLLLKGEYKFWHLLLDKDVSALLVREKETMLRWALTFLVIALIAAFLGFGGIAGAAAGIAKILFYVFLVIFVVSLVLGLFRRPV